MAGRNETRHASEKQLVLTTLSHLDCVPNLLGHPVGSLLIDAIHNFARNSANLLLVGNSNSAYTVNFIIQSWSHKYSDDNTILTFTSYALNSNKNILQYKYSLV